MPRGDVKAYATLIARVPQALVDQVKSHASHHRCSVSELIREGLEMRLESGDVPGRSTGSSRDAKEEVLREGLLILPEVLPSLSSMLLAQMRDTIRTTLTEVSPGHTRAPQPQTSITEEGPTEVLHTPDAPVPPFDPQRFLLGRLCPRGHAYGTTGQSLLTRASRHCPQCDTEQARERRARRNAAPPQEG